MKIFKRPNALKTLTTVCFAILFLVFSTPSCTKKVGLAPKPAAVTQCDTISYAEDIAPIIAKNCSISGCHVAPNNFEMNTYDLLKLKAENGKIKLRVIDPHPNPMPPAGLTPDEKKQIECWLNNGYKP